jgi:C1A family cysteine protease
MLSPVLGEDFDWRSISGAGGSFISSVKNQGPAGTCWAFSSTSTFEARLKITRNDPTWTPDLSEQNLVCPGTMGDVVNGGYEYECMDYFTSNGTVLESVLPYTQQNTSPNWPLAYGWQQKVARTASDTNWIGSSTTDLEAELKQYGPLDIGINAGIMSTSPPTATTAIGGNTDVDHAVSLIGYHDTGDLSTSYWIIKNQWGTGWGNAGIGYISFGDVEYYARVGASTGPAYFVGALNTATWAGGSGNWSTSAKWKRNGFFATWNNGEDAAIFNSAGGSITVGSNSSAHGITIAPGATGYSFSNGSLTVTAGGITAGESVSFSTPITAGAPQQWSVAAGKTLTLNSTLNLHISTLQINGAGDVVANSNIFDVASNPVFAGLLSGAGGTLLKMGTGTLMLSGIAGGITLPGGATVGGGGRILWDNTAYNKGDRMVGAGGAAMPLSLAGGELAIAGNSVGTSVMVGPVTLTGGQNTLTIQLNQGATTLTADSLTRAIPGGKIGWGTLLVRGTHLGSPVGADDAAIYLSTPPDMSPAGSGPSTPISPWMLADTSASGTGADFATYDAVTGLRPLTDAEHSSTLDADTNVKLATSDSLSASLAVRSIILTNDGTAPTALSLNPGALLTLSAQGLLSSGNASNTISGGSLTGSMFNGTQELIAFTLADLTISSALVNSEGGMLSLTKAGPGNLLLTALSSPLTGVVHVNQGSLIVTGGLTHLSNFFVNGGAATIDGGTVTTSAWSSIGQGTGDNGTLLLKNHGRMTINGDLNIGDLTASIGAATVQEESVFAIRRLYVGKSGTAVGSMTLTGGTISYSGSGGNDWRIGGGTGPNDLTAAGVLTVSDGLFSSGPMNLQIGAYGVGTLNQTGGIVNCDEWPVVGI